MTFAWMLGWLVLYASAELDETWPALRDDLHDALLRSEG